MTDPAAELERIRRENARTVEGRRLDEKGRCCGRKPLVYKRPSFHYFCSRCDREYSPDGRQQENWKWEAGPGGFTLTEGAQRAAANTAARDLGLPFPYGMGR